MVTITTIILCADDKTINTHEKFSNSFYLFFISGQIIKSYKNIVLPREENNLRFICRGRQEAKRAGNIIVDVDVDDGGGENTPKIYSSYIYTKVMKSYSGKVVVDFKWRCH